MKILLATSELYPYSKTGGLADMVAALGKTLAKQGHQVGIVTPLYAGIQEKWPDLEKMDWKLQVSLDWKSVEGAVYQRKTEDGCTLYFIAQGLYFDRDGIYQHKGVDFADNAERYTFFSKAVVNLAEYLPWQPELVHVHDWQTSLVPLLLKHLRSSGALQRKIASCLTIHNLAYQGLFAKEVFAMANVPWGYFDPAGAEYYGNFNFLKTGIVFADTLTTVSPHYAEEIQGAEYGVGLNGILNQRKNDLTGILNGADYDVWNTETNPSIPFHYSVKSMAGKTKCKTALQRRMGLPEDPKIPLFANIGRMAEQKGVDIMIPAVEDILTGDVQFVCLGGGAAHYERGVQNLHQLFPQKTNCFIGYDPQLAHLITAGADFFLMPSQYEPCGLNQMYSLRYGTLPIVRDTGGLSDSVIDPHESADKADGFKFSRYSANDLGRAIIRALSIYYSPARFKAMRRNAMAADFSWDQTARSYVRVYQKAIEKN
ncbi:MAG: glycogen synthase GlgA [Verrucomicrobia bacterium]|nr:glycogen synthase GlgA [Verrucomicrobiota bacterium]MBO4716065.1 glycogen synthase GlgA [Verrucomicrobiota bacterium]MBR5978649.1 glycogen synthase GlgA [Verrucomicrobiota bacterium]